MISIGYCKKDRKCLKINQGKEFIAGASASVKESWQLGDGSVLWPHFG